MVALREYQLKLKGDLREAIHQGSKAPCAVLPTGGGKTTIFADMALGAVAKGKRVCVLAHRRELINQAAQRLESFGLNPARVMPGGAGGGRSFFRRFCADVEGEAWGLPRARPPHRG